MITTPIPDGYATVNPFIITADAEGAARFIREVFGAEERPETRTEDVDGLLLHLEVALGDTTIALAERKPDWPETPALLQVWVRDAAATVAAARDRGSRVVTEPTPFFGDTLARFIDPFGNLWWLYQHDPTAAEWGDAGWDESAGSDADAHASWEPTPELVAINTTLSEAMRSLRA